MYRTTLDGRLLQANGALASMFGFESPEEMRKATRNKGTATLWESPRQREAFLEKVVAAEGTPLRGGRSSSSAGTGSPCTPTST